MSLVANVWNSLRQRLAQLITASVLIGLLLTSCGPSESSSQNIASTDSSPSLFTPRPKIKQVETPQLIQSLEPWLDNYQPQVAIRQPNADQIIEDTTVEVNLRVRDLPIYKDETWQLGPHVDLWLDNQPYGSIYDVGQPVVLENVSPGTHTLRAFAVRPWQESFKNEAAYDQITFHVFAKSNENAPAAEQPLLTYGSPVGSYGAEPVLLDFYLTDAPLHQVAQENPAIADWRIRYTVNGDSLTLDTWEPIYIEGLKTGRNWVQLALVDEDGAPIEGVFNNTVQVIDYDPTQQDGLATIVQGDIGLEMVGGIVDPSYEPPALEVPDTALEVPDTALEVPDTTDLENTPDSLPPGDNAEASNEPEIVEPEIVEPEGVEPGVVEPANTEARDVPGNDVPDNIELDVAQPTDRSDDAVEQKNIFEEPSKMDAISPTEGADVEDSADAIENPGATALSPEALGKNLGEEGAEPILESEPAQTESQPVERVNANERPADDGLQAEADEQPADGERNLTADEGDTNRKDAASETTTETETARAPQGDTAVEPPNSSRKYLQRFYDYREKTMGEKSGG
ncbi:hypothetical protein [Leptothoe kymatousa]|uniref:Uncharacterized protein n=1 Tax=Leptothoe kymatousa TAU-MAC 1615 TaxID=2364775 RepID=A0ABS5XZ65_9CYAN|nr:hypothetical protein [Leptothoe kymatousa]MBT9310875.1 hypothetical protein [Leptothoe kymatousa TAU-MAC 1615]